MEILLKYKLRGSYKRCDRINCSNSSGIDKAPNTFDWAGDFYHQNERNHSTIIFFRKFTTSI
ncbi:MAG TPA: hypothetical protein VIL78_03370 [Hanamia sp.]